LRGSTNSRTGGEESLRCEQRTGSHAAVCRNTMRRPVGAVPVGKLLGALRRRGRSNEGNRLSADHLQRLSFVGGRRGVREASSQTPTKASLQQG
jgi:hypothetical protein